MKVRLLNILSRIRKVNKYILSVVIFFVITFVLGDSNIVKQIQYSRQIHNLENQIEFYRQQKAQNEEKLRALHSSDENLERFAREQYRMTKPNEDLFIIVPDEK